MPGNFRPATVIKLPWVLLDLDDGLPRLDIIQERHVSACTCCKIAKILKYEGIGGIIKRFPPSFKIEDQDDEWKDTWSLCCEIFE